MSTSPSQPPPAAPGPEQALAALERVLASAPFAGAGRLRAFLAYIVHEAVAGRGELIKGYTLGREVFERGPDFDPQLDSIVRVEAGRLRARLAEYYRGEGADDPVRIELPKGGYVPSFHLRPETAPVTAAAGGRRRLLLALAAAALLLALIAGVAAWLLVPAAPVPAPADATRASGGTPRLLVRPFVDIGGDPAQRWFAHGLTEQITVDLARQRDFEVIGGATAESFAGRPLDIRALARDLGVGYVLQGSLRRTPERLRVTAQLLSAENARVLWVGEYDRPLEVADIVAVQDDIAERVVAAIARPSGALVRAERQARAAPTDSLEAYDCFLYGVDYWTELSPTYHARLRSCLERAVAGDPGFAGAWALLALTLLDERRMTVGPGREAAVARAQQAAEAALRLDPLHPTGWRALASARFFAGQRDEFREAAARALELGQADPDILADMGGKLAYAGDWEQGTTLIRRALELNPAQAGWYSLPLAVERLRAQDYEAALAHARHVWLPGFYGAHLVRAAILGKLERREEAAAELDAALRLVPTWPVYGPAELEQWNLEPALVATFLDGLARAGLKLGERGA